MKKIVLVLAYLATLFFVISALTSRGAAWSEVLVAIVPGVVLIASMHALIDRGLAKEGRHGSAYRWWRFGTIAFLVLGALIVVVTSQQLDDDLSMAAIDQRYGTQRGSFNLYEAYAKEDRLGRQVGVGFLVLGVVAVALAVPRRKRARHSMM